MTIYGYNHKDFFQNKPLAYSHKNKNNLLLRNLTNILVYKVKITSAQWFN